MRCQTLHLVERPDGLECAGAEVAVDRTRVVLQRGQSPLELYDLKADVGEKTDVAAAHPDVVKRIEAVLAREYVPSKTFWDQFCTKPKCPCDRPQTPCPIPAAPPGPSCGAVVNLRATVYTCGDAVTHRINRQVAGTFTSMVPA